MLAAILYRIEKRLAATGLKAATACRNAGLDAGAIRDLQRGVSGKHAARKGVKTETLAKLAPILRTSVQWLATGEGAEEADPAAAVADGALDRLPRDVPVLGTAAGSLGEGAFIFESGTVDFAARPPALAQARDIYALYVVNDSMDPQHPPGQLCFIHPHRAPAPGDSVILHVQTSATAPQQYYIKRLVRRGPEEIVCIQHNPPATIRFKTAHVVAIHKVLTTNEMFGV